MINIPNLSNLPNKEDLEYKEKTFLIDVRDQFHQTSKKWYWGLLATIIISLPLGFLLRRQLASFIIGRQEPIPVNENLYHASDLKAAEVDFIFVNPGLVSAYAHVSNPNADLSARSFSYEFVFKNSSGSVMKTIRGESFLLPGASRYVILPAVTVAENPSTINFSMSNPRWTRAMIPDNPEFTILQPKWGDADSKFFVEGLVKNPYSFVVKKLNLSAVIFDQANRTPLAVNHTVLDDLAPLESRYFRLFWPKSQSDLFGQVMGQVQLKAEINPLNAEFELAQ
ncbi:MAG: hypothetical protein A3C85_02180 [Candidatus Doudnabacteria bacterium RIFCSPHIGHO2_02_FULL_48_21]|uniref:Uncharacterized protein n=1 Tax=Candidatus Doudnabacteria bacterium RIFCSPLOWO2_02_FULL_48_13 TaxID=1817845 RepID=A0A1F5Q9V9_9BACT|nr:MAG: hypothetical protein A3K05_02470 [Candidatus Doudnabacteria bacterium RIFCSPHIGHO2_01_48_18]OGE78443.1 MAG: hypothetical protein A2668_04475 [Candidatus Doudnabacteria bacterium RIFCSPHIGHO2_01_FULL_48_180]OGE91697.1 MAG: hypothetical protein A3F44_01505 [Candidatus Doudnabacteria bacterium RIFCSPHIGHO2_12_FULL_47_25]OGE93434.1 MAG: hypothetical protein A3C85_02180 [Candidatus Doudnabacteria bacterium RIFCSPHIGHO2_02_FULL_48_21]OGE97839.1 MAG: hypothetical protein A3A83_03740 [Candidatu